jgi:hypothetical protein
MAKLDDDKLELREHDQKVGAMVALAQRQMVEVNLDGYDLTEEGPHEPIDQPYAAGVITAREQQIEALQQALSALHDSVFQTYADHTPVEAMAVKYVEAIDCHTDLFAKAEQNAVAGEQYEHHQALAAGAFGAAEVWRRRLVNAVRSALT